MSAEIEAPAVDKKAVERLVSRLKKTLDQPEQAGLELDPDGCLHLSALAGKFRPDKLRTVLAMEPDASVADILAKFRKTLTKVHPKTFEFSVQDEGNDLAVRLCRPSARLDAAAKAEARQEPTVVFPGAVPHSFRGLYDRGPDGRQALFAAHLRVGVPVLFVEPRGVAEYRGVENLPVVEFLQNCLDSGAYQLAVLTWAGADDVTTRLDKAQARATFALERLLGAQVRVPVFALAGSRAGLAAMAQMAAHALDTTAVVLARGHEVLEATFKANKRHVLTTVANGSVDGGEPHFDLTALDCTQIWVYASESTRSTSSTGSASGTSAKALTTRNGTTLTPPVSAHHPHGGSDGRVQAAAFACKMWTAVRDQLTSSERALLLRHSAVVVDTAALAAGAPTAQDGPPLKAIESIMAPSSGLSLPADAAVFESIPLEKLLVEENEEASVTEAALEAVRNATAASGLPVVGALLAGVLSQDEATFPSWLSQHGNLLRDLASTVSEQTRCISVVVHLYSILNRDVANEAHVARLRGVPTGISILKVFKLMYDEDICEEEAFLRWADGIAKGKSADNSKIADSLRHAVEPFLTWLREAGEAESEED
eukprot:m.372281 g.372281  ORF g.372281 m.372281 type:complete len:598 (-) comp20870_c0_seq2:252-2045(-)